VIHDLSTTLFAKKKRSFYYLKQSHFVHLCKNVNGDIGTPSTVFEVIQIYHSTLELFDFYLYHKITIKDMKIR
jgi:hypothetical protein